jgi:hypothetical protein
MVIVCCVCGVEASLRCPPCAEQGFEIAFCGADHQKLVSFPCLHASGRIDDNRLGNADTPYSPHTGLVRSQEGLRQELSAICAPAVEQERSGRHQDVASSSFLRSGTARQTSVQLFPSFRSRRAFFLFLLLPHSRAHPSSPLSPFSTKSRKALLTATARQTKPWTLSPPSEAFERSSVETPSLMTPNAVQAANSTSPMSSIESRRCTLMNRSTSSVK